jgi:hypothetical protein
MTPAANRTSGYRIPLTAVGVIAALLALAAAFAIPRLW